MRACLDDSVPGHPRRRVQAQPLRRASCVSPRAAAARSVGRTPPLARPSAAPSRPPPRLAEGLDPSFRDLPRQRGLLVRRPSVDALAPALHQRRRRCPRRRDREASPSPLDAAELQNPSAVIPPRPPLDASTLRPIEPIPKIHTYIRRSCSYAFSGSDSFPIRFQFPLPDEIFALSFLHTQKRTPLL